MFSLWWLIGFLPYYILLEGVHKFSEIRNLPSTPLCEAAVYRKYDDWTLCSCNALLLYQQTAVPAGQVH